MTDMNTQDSFYESYSSHEIMQQTHWQHYQSQMEAIANVAHKYKEILEDVNKIDPEYKSQTILACIAEAERYNREKQIQFMR